MPETGQESTEAKATDGAQKVLEGKVVQAPKDYRIVHEREYGNPYLFAEVKKPVATEVEINLLIGAYVEVDGKPFTHFERTMTFAPIGSKP